MPAMSELRVVNAGRVGAARSQALWHGIASAMAADERPTLSFCRSTAAYVCLGYHHPLADIDLEACRRRDLPILRRRIGGGPVYMDGDQLLFQLTMPAGRAPVGVDRLYRTLLGPAVTAFRALGAAARLSGVNDIAVGDRKISGTGAGQIGDAVTVVGNVIFAFPYEQMVEVLNLPSEGMRRRCLALMRRHLAPIDAVVGGTSGNRNGQPVSEDEARGALIRAYGEAMERTACEGELTDREEEEIGGWEKRLADPEWVAGPPPPARSAHRVKIHAEVWALRAQDGDWGLEYSVVGGVLQDVEVATPGLNGGGERLAAALSGLPADVTALARRLEPFGEAGRRVAAIAAPGLHLR